MAERITRAAQENLISLLAHSNKHGKVIAQLVDPELFEGDYRVIAARVVDYWKQHKKAPRVHTADLLSDVIHDNKNRRSETYKRILRQMQELAGSGEINIEYVMQQLTQFTRLQHMKDAILRSADILQKQQELGIGDVEKMLADLMRAREFNFQVGLRLSDAVPRVYDYLERRKSEYGLGIPIFDTRGIVPYRNAVMIFLAPTGRGKSWFLVRVGKQALLMRKKVLHVTLEMDEDEVAQRYYQSFFAMPKHKAAEAITVPRFKFEPYGTKVPTLIKSITTQEIEPGTSFMESRGMTVLTRKVSEWKTGLSNIIVKRFPMRSVTVDDLRAYLDTLEGAAGFTPDLLILDYVGIMKTAGSGAKDYRIGLGRTMEEFRGLCQERNIAGVTAAQVGRVGMNARTLKTTHIAEDISLINTSDIAITYSQTDAEQRMGLARLFVDKARSEEDKFGLVISQSYQIGQFVLDSGLLKPSYFEQVPGWDAKEGGEDDDDDDGEPAAPAATTNSTRKERRWKRD